MSDIIIFTDGSSRGNPGPGGYGAIVSDGAQVTELGGRELNTTNNRMELAGLISALDYISKKSLDREIEAHLDSQYVMRGVQHWLAGWQKNGWKTKAKRDVLNRDLWEKLADLLENKSIKWKHVGGHVGIPGNERVDEIATEYADGSSPILFSGPATDYKIDLTATKGSAEKSATKSKKKNRSDKPAFSYVSLVDGVIMIHKTWAECSKRVKGVSNTKFQKALSKIEEQEIVKNFESLM